MRIGIVPPSFPRPVRYEIDILPSHYDLINKGLNVYHFVVPIDPEPGTYGANPNNRGNQLKDIKPNDSIVFKVSKERRASLGPKGVEYENDLERVVVRRENRPEAKQNTVYLHLR